MSRLVFLLIACSVSLSAIAQIVLKTGMSSPVVQVAIQGGSGLRAAGAIATNLFVLGGLFLYFASAAVWLLVLARTDVSTAYPFVGSGFVLTMLLAYAFIGEPLTLAKVCGTLLIATGIAIIARY